MILVLINFGINILNITWSWELMFEPQHLHCCTFLWRATPNCPGCSVHPWSWSPWRWRCTPSPSSPPPQPQHIVFPQPADLVFDPPCFHTEWLEFSSQTHPRTLYLILNCCMCLVWWHRSHMHLPKEFWEEGGATNGNQGDVVVILLLYHIYCGLTNSHQCTGPNVSLRWRISQRWHHTAASLHQLVWSKSWSRIWTSPDLLCPTTELQCFYHQLGSSSLGSQLRE